MNASDPSFAEFLTRLRQGDAEAGRQLWERFAQRLIRLARQNLDARLRGKVDPEDVMQSVFKSFFRIQREEHIRLRGWDDLWSLLTTIALRKCGHRLAYYRTARRDVHRERVAPVKVQDAGTGWEAIAREPTPLEALTLCETVEELLRPLGQRDRQMAALALQGYTRQEIAQQVGYTERTVYRVLERLRNQLEHILETTP